MHWLCLLEVKVVLIFPSTVGREDFEILNWPRIFVSSKCSVSPSGKTICQSSRYWFAREDGESKSISMYLCLLRPMIRKKSWKSNR